MTAKRIILAGGSGFLGTLLARALAARGDSVVVLTRRPSLREDEVREESWDGRTVGHWAGLLNGAHGVFNFAGRSIDCRFTEKNRREIIASRVNSTRAIGEAIRRCAEPPAVWVQAAGDAIYGDSDDRWHDETSPPGAGFLVETCRLWEQAFNESPTPKTRRMLTRIGFVLSAEGGALPKLAGLARWGLGGRAGNGRQYISWIHAQDLVRIFLRALDSQGMEGVFNATAPNPVTNDEFMRDLRRALHRPWSPPVPAWAVRVGGWLMGTEPALALTGRRCRPKRLGGFGFWFRFPGLGRALAEIYGGVNGWN